MSTTFISDSSGRKSLSATVTQKIQAMIVEEGLKPGTKLPSESRLAEMYHVSRPTIREAMKALRAQNVVVIRQGDGTYISDNTGVGEDPLGLQYIDRKELTEGVFEARLLIEPQIAMLAAQRATEEDLQLLRHTAEQMQTVSYWDPARTSLDIEFHTQIAKAAKNSVFNQIMPVIYETIEKGACLLHEAEENYRRAQRMHMQIFRAIEKRDPFLAENIVKTHIYLAIDDINRLPWPSPQAEERKV